MVVPVKNYKQAVEVLLATLSACLILGACEPGDGDGASEGAAGSKSASGGNGASSGGSAGNSSGGSASGGGSSGGSSSGGAVATDPLDGFPETLAETGLYQAGSTAVLADGVRFYQPRFELYSDGASKRRFVLLPAGSTIDTSDADFWQLPEGSKLWKEFWVEGKLIETRLLQNREGSWKMMAYAWDEAGAEARAVPEGQSAALGTEHVIPSVADCDACHERMPGRVLGFSALQLSELPTDLSENPLGLSELAQEGRLSNAVSVPALPGSTLEQDVFGYLHANCGQCHHARSSLQLRVNLDLWLQLDELGSWEETAAYRTLVDAPISSPDSPMSAPLRVTPQNVEQSQLHLRMQSTKSGERMPPLAVRAPDDDALALVESWIQTLPLAPD